MVALEERELGLEENVEVRSFRILVELRDLEA
jgi:hypothetical protein